MEFAASSVGLGEAALHEPMVTLNKAMGSRSYNYIPVQVLMSRYWK